ncbi:MAG: riboflavin synthase [Planctomycetota bacterium]|nr:riboflavin synthase [Planctomycetota bacterium]
MFTGLVQAVGRVAELAPSRAEGVRSGGNGGGGGGGGGGWAGQAGMLRLTVDVGDWAHGPSIRAGDSISINGCCLTAVADAGVDGGVCTVGFDAVAETLAKTTLGALRVGDPVNLEHAATASTFLGGHIVQGHVDGVGRVTRVQATDDWRVWFEVPAALAEYLAPKGSVCVDGVSLTIAEVTMAAGQATGFGVALIPTTLDRTTLRRLAVGDGVNLEMDIISKQVVFWLKARESRR